MGVDAITPTANQTHPKRYLELDGLRGIAIGMVLIYHYFTTILVAQPPQTILSYARAATGFFWGGVDLFFVLSGFLVATVFLNDLENKSPLRAFYLRRTARILPLYWVVLFVAMILTMLPGGLGALTHGNYPAWIYLLFLQNFELSSTGSFGGIWLAPTWSLAIEEQFYLVLPIIMLARSARWVVVIAIVAIVVINPAIKYMLVFRHEQTRRTQAF